MISHRGWLLGLTDISMSETPSSRTLFVSYGADILETMNYLIDWIVLE
jgi:hypothetical protein